MGVGDFDLYGEVALRDSGEIDRVRYAPDAIIPDPPTLPSWQDPNSTDTANARLAQVVNALYPVSRTSGYRAQSVAGLNYSQKYNDNDTFTVGAEYFFNPLGYSASPRTRASFSRTRTHSKIRPPSFTWGSTTARSTSRFPHRSSSTCTPSRFRRSATCPIGRSSRASTTRSSCSPTCASRPSFPGATEMKMASFDSASNRSTWAASRSAAHPPSPTSGLRCESQSEASPSRRAVHRT